MSDVYNDMMKSYEDSHNKKISTVKKYNLKNYFSTYLEDGVLAATKNVRILPPTEGSKVPWIIKMGHKIKIDGKWKTFACLKHEEGKECPFCEAREALLATGKDSDKKLAKTYNVKKMYILKVIDRDALDFTSDETRESSVNGIRFWRFNHDYRKTGTLDKIMGVMGAVKHDITDPITGRDIQINLARDTENRPVIQSITYPLESTKLSDDENQMNTWLNDNRTWRDVYSIRNYDYLAIVVTGETPVYDKAKEMFVSKEKRERIAAESEKLDNDDYDSELRMGGDSFLSETPTTPQTTQVDVNQSQVQSGGLQPEDDDDDLPF